MEERKFTYVIVGGGLAGASAVNGIREVDATGSILLVGSEKHLPYHRPPLTKSLWSGKKKVDDIFVLGSDSYDRSGVTLALGLTVSGLDLREKRIVAENGQSYRFEKLLLATGAHPLSLSVSGGNLEGICYFRYLDDYLKLQKQATQGKTALVIGGGFIGSEIAASLTRRKVSVTMLFPGPFLCSRVFPEYLGRATGHLYEERGVKILSGERVASIEKRGTGFVTVTGQGKRIESDLLIAGIGVKSEVRLARMADLKTGNGIIVDDCLQTSHPDIFAAGDNAEFPYRALGKTMRVEHWDNALNQGKLAGRNMAGAHERYAYMPYFFSDLFEFGYEAVGEVNGELATYADWQKENDTGVIYYFKNDRVRGVMLCNMWDKVAPARELIEKGRQGTPESFKGAIR